MLSPSLSCTDKMAWCVLVSLLGPGTVDGSTRGFDSGTRWCCTEYIISSMAMLLPRPVPVLTSLFRFQASTGRRECTHFFTIIYFIVSQSLPQPPSRVKYSHTAQCTLRITVKPLSTLRDTRKADSTMMAQASRQRRNNIYLPSSSACTSGPKASFSGVNRSDACRHQATSRAEDAFLALDDGWFGRWFAWLMECLIAGRYDTSVTQHDGASR